MATAEYLDRELSSAEILATEAREKYEAAKAARDKAKTPRDRNRARKAFLAAAEELEWATDATAYLSHAKVD